jgi:hypothetical protein
LQALTVAVALKESLRENEDREKGKRENEDGRGGVRDKAAA